MKKIIIFDLDGTLIDSLSDLAIATNFSLENMGFPTHPIEAYKYFVGNGVAKLLERAVPEAERTNESLIRARELFDQYYGQHSLDYTKPYPGIMELLAHLKNKGYALAVATNKPHEYANILVKQLLGEMIDLVVGQQEDVPPKPHPQCVHYILQELNYTHEECLYIGDSDVDIKTAQNATVDSVGVLWGFRTEEELRHAGATHIIDSPEALLDVLHCK